MQMSKKDLTLKEWEDLNREKAYKYAISNLRINPVMNTECICAGCGTKYCDRDWET